MTLIPDDVAQQLPSLHSQDQLPDAQLFAYARLTVQEARLTWYVLELHTDQDLFSGYLVDPQAERFGYFSLAYLEEQLELLRLRLEYDQHFTPKSLVEAISAERTERRRLGEQFPVDVALAPHRAYYYVAAYPNDATEEYRRIRSIVLKQAANLSVFHIPPITLSPGWHIVIIGDRPAEAIHAQIIAVLSGGTLTTIPYALLMQLFARKMEQNEKGERREIHTTIRLKRRKKKSQRKGGSQHRGRKR